MGRPKGSPNKTTVELKTALMEAFRHSRGGAGIEFFLRMKEEKPEIYTRMLEKVLPSELKIDPASAGLILEIRDYTGGKSGGIIKEGDEQDGPRAVH